MTDFESGDERWNGESQDFGEDHPFDPQGGVRDVDVEPEPVDRATVDEA